MASQSNPSLQDSCRAVLAELVDERTRSISLLEGSINVAAIANFRQRVDQLGTAMIEVSKLMAREEPPRPPRPMWLTEGDPQPRIHG